MSNTETAARPESYPMTGGGGTYSYSSNSIYQKEAANFVKELIDEEIATKLDMKCFTTSTSNTLRVADLGCSTGPNTFIAMQNILQAMKNKYHSQGSLPSEMPEFQVFFNDHASNDFNTVFTSLPPDSQYFAAGVPGSFYGRLFPESSLHFVYSSYAMNWLSKVPEELLDQNSPAWNKEKFHYTTAKEEVANVYAAQFAKDMEIFLGARAKEMVVGAMMVVIIMGFPDDIHHSKLFLGQSYDFLSSCLMDLVNMGLVSEAEADSFNIPVYGPSPKEMASVVEKNGCFSTERMQLNDYTYKYDAQTFLKHQRATLESILTKHFGSEIVDQLYQRASQRSAEFSSVLHSSDAAMKNQLFLVLKRK
ncbi:loganic acid O-methyltransferase-like [Cornus florida]|uniref:loganic acid O-methyltransferase-like n=1 Tax=Cornus florida TaxID=4283 RepID=UPI00289BDBCC|nr:loganic acid O-methyltransferase-like [Cornus florida]